MVTPTSFMHIRSTLGLALHVRQLARQLRNAINQVSELEEAEKKAEQEREASKVVERWDELLAAFAQEAQLLAHITREEEIILFEEERGEEQEEKETKRLLDRLKLDESQKEKLETFFVGIRESVREMHEAAKIVRMEESDMYLQRERFLKYIAIRNDGTLAKSIRRLARNEYKFIRIFDKEESKIEELIEALSALADKETRKKDIDKIIEQMDTEETTLLEDVKDELSTLKEIMHDVNIIMFHLLEKVMHESSQDFDKLLSSNFPADQIQGVMEHHKILVQNIHKTLRTLYRMATYDQQLAT